MEEFAVGIRHDAFGVFVLRRLEGRGYAWVMGIECGLGDHGQQIAPVVSVLLSVERRWNVAVVRAGALLQHFDERLVKVVVLRLPALSQVRVAGLAGHLDGQLNAIKLYPVRWPGTYSLSRTLLAGMMWSGSAARALLIQSTARPICGSAHSAKALSWVMR